VNFLTLRHASIGMAVTHTAVFLVIFVFSRHGVLILEVSVVLIDFAYSDEIPMVSVYADEREKGVELRRLVQFYALLEKFVSIPLMLVNGVGIKSLTRLSG